MCEVYLERDGATYTVSAKGHATGSTETCAAISSLACALQSWLMNADGVEQCGAAVESGDVFLKWRGGSDDVWTLMLCGFLGIEACDPERVRVSVAEI